MVDDLELASVAGFEGSKGVRDFGENVVGAVADIEGAYNSGEEGYKGVDTDTDGVVGVI